MDTARTQLVASLWDQAYKSFNRSNEALQNAAILGSAQVSTDVGHRLLATISKLRHDSTDQVAVGDARADIMLAEASGWLPNDTAAQMLDALDRLSQAD